MDHFAKSLVVEVLVIARYNRRTAKDRGVLCEIGHDNQEFASFEKKFVWELTDIEFFSFFPCLQPAVFSKIAGG